MGGAIEGRWGRGREERREGKLWLVYKIDEKNLIKIISL